MKVLGLDWDGTMVHHGNRRPDFYDPVSIRLSTKPYQQGLQRARNLMDHGTLVHIITGRGDGLRALTLAQVRQFLRWDFPAERLHNSPRWEGYAALRAYKANKLNEIQPDLFVGDHAECDEMAAADAGVAFMPAVYFRSGYPFPAPNKPWEAQALIGVV